MSVEIATRGLEALQSFFDRAPEIAEQAARFAVTDTAAFARRESSKEIRAQVNFGRNYLAEDTGRLTVINKTFGGDPEAVIRGREEPTSLARFSTTPARFGSQGRGGVRVNVGGSNKKMDRAFFVKLRKGNTAISDGSHNVGLAIRLKKGEAVKNKTKMRSMGGGLYLLYGPSVAQVFDDVALALAPELSDRLEANFVRHFLRLSNNG